MTASPAPVSLGLCLIVRDEMRYLDACVQSVRDYVDEIIVVDTGSRDGTAERAARIATRTRNIEFDEDFSRARNAALDLATADWVLFLDADERVPADQAVQLRSTAARAPANTLAISLMRYNLFANGEFYSGRQIRLIRRSAGVRYRRRINESVKDSVRELGGGVLAAPLFFNHFGHCRPVAEREAKARRYIELMRRQLGEHPNDPILEGYVALNLRVLGRFDEASTWSQSSVKHGEFHPTVWAFRGHVLRSLGDRDGALDAYRRSSALAPDAAASNLAGVLLMQDDLVAARRAFDEALSLEPLTLSARINLGLTYQAEGHWKRAAEMLREVSDINPAFLIDEWDARDEVDPFRSFYNETLLRYAGLGYHIAYCEHQAGEAFPVIRSRT